MACDLRRLWFAVRKAAEAKNEDWRMRLRIAGIKVPEPEPEDDETFNAQIRATVAMFRRQV